MNKRPTARPGRTAVERASELKMPILAFGIFEVDRGALELRRQGRKLRLQDQPFSILCRLLEQPGEVVTRDELRQVLWADSVYVDFDHGLNNAIARLREVLGDDAASPRYIETLPRHGYRFICPVRAHQPQPARPLSAETPPAALRAPDPEPSPRFRAWRWATAGVAVALAAALWLGLRTGSTDRAVEQPSVAVLPFTSLSSNPDDEYFADGLSEELLNQLARIRGLRIAGRMSSLYFRDPKESPQAIAEALGVDHLLQGSVRHSGERVRITSRLTDTRNGEQLWSETFERDLEDIFAIEDEIALAVASALQIRLVETDQHHLHTRGTRNVEAYRLYLMGSAKLRARGVRLDRDGALRLFEQATARDPGFGAAYAGIASYHFNLAVVGGNAIEEGSKLGRIAAERAIVLDPDGSEALRVMADFEMTRYRYGGEFDAYVEAQRLFQRAIAVDPSNSYAYFDYARAIQWHDPTRALELFERAAELEPLVPMPIGLGALAMSRLGMHDAARQRIRNLVAIAGEEYSSLTVSAFELNLGAPAGAIPPLLIGHAGGELPGSASLALWGLYMSLGDRAAANAALDNVGDEPHLEALRVAAVLVSEGRYAEAFERLDSRREEFPVSRVLDFPAARLALIAGASESARAILERRLPDIANGSEPVTAPRVLPALDLVLAWSRTGRVDDASRLLERIDGFLGKDDAPRLPLFTVQRARGHALAGHGDLARAALERAYAAGFRTTCALDLHPQPLLYVDCIDRDPAFDALRGDGRFDSWLARIEMDNRSSLQQLRTHRTSDATRPGRASLVSR